MKPRFLADENFNHLILKAILRREPSIDVEDAPEAKLTGLDDMLVLKRASEQERILLTHDIRTMPAHFANFLVEHTSPGLVIVPNRLRISTVVEDLLENVERD